MTTQHRYQVYYLANLDTHDGLDPKHAHLCDAALNDAVLLMRARACPRFLAGVCDFIAADSTDERVVYMDSVLFPLPSVRDMNTGTVMHGRKVQRWLQQHTTFTCDEEDCDRHGCTLVPEYTARSIPTNRNIPHKSPKSSYKKKLTVQENTIPLNLVTPIGPQPASTPRPAFMRPQTHSNTQQTRHSPEYLPKPQIVQPIEAYLPPVTSTPYQNDLQQSVRFRTMYQHPTAQNIAVTRKAAPSIGPRKTQLKYSERANASNPDSTFNPSNNNSQAQSHDNSTPSQPSQTQNADTHTHPRHTLFGERIKSFFAFRSSPMMGTSVANVEQRA